MKRMSSQSFGIDQGDNVMFSDYEDGGEMWTGSGPRERRRSIKFSEPFRGLPAVQCTLSMWDMDHATNVRSEIAAEKVTKAGFDLIFRTWGDTKVARARIGWIAFGEIRNDDDWDVS